MNRTETCWLWTGGRAGHAPHQYGCFWSGERKIPAHVWAYEHWVGPVPEGLELDHVVARGCSSKLCVNPAHLEPVTHAENRRRARLTLCRRGLHDLSNPVHQKFDAQGRRRGCITCHREAARVKMKRLYHERKAQP